ncbi:unnamed protein product, partial [Ectocarpus sp. 4 AP-2014]
MPESRVAKAGGTGGDGRAETAHLRKYDEHKAQLCLADEELRPALRAGYMKFTELKRRFPRVDELQHDYLARVALARPLIGALPRPEGETGGGDDLLDQYRRAELKTLAETNPLVHVALTVIETLKNATKICLVCGVHIRRFTYTRSILTVGHQPLCSSISKALEQEKRWKFEFQQVRSPATPSKVFGIQETGPRMDYNVKN